MTDPTGRTPAASVRALDRMPHLKRMASTVRIHEDVLSERGGR